MKKKKKKKKRNCLGETQMQKQLVEYMNLLKEQGHDFEFFHVRNNWINRNYKPMGLLPGVSDLVLLRNKKVFFLELKTDKGKMSERQKAFHSTLERFSLAGKVAYGYDEMKYEVNKFLRIK